MPFNLSIKGTYRIPTILSTIIICSFFITYCSKKKPLPPPTKPPLEIITFYDSVMFIHRNASLKITDVDKSIKPTLEGINVEIKKNSGVFVYKDRYYIAYASRLSRATIFTTAPFINSGNCDTVNMQKAYSYLDSIE